MNIKSKILVLLCLSALFLSFKTRPIHVFMAGDSTMANKLFYKSVTDSFTGEVTYEKFLERGWGQLLPEYFTDHVIVRNFAQKDEVHELLFQKVGGIS
jgi:hypothetical protein